MQDMMKRCMEPHALLHSVSGVGVGLLLAAWNPTYATYMIGAVVLVLSVVGEFMLPMKKK